MKILHIIPYVTVKTGGPATTLSHMITIWNASGFPSEVLTLDRGPEVVGIDTEVHMLPMSFPRRFSNSREALAWLRANHYNFDLFICHEIWTLLSLRSARLLRILHRPYVVIPHGSLTPFDVLKKKWLKQLLGPIIIKPHLDHAAFVLCSTQREGEVLVRYGATPKIVVIPWTVDCEYYEIDREREREKLGFAADEFIVLFLGRIDFKKGLQILLPAFKELLDSGVKARLVVVGPDSRGFKKVVLQYAETLRILEKMLFIDMAVKREKAALYRAADCFALSSLDENFGNTVVEAMQHGLPVVVSRNVYIWDAVERSGGGIVCPYNIPAIAAALMTLAASPALRKEIAQKALAGGNDFRPAALRKRYEDLLNGLELPSV